MFERDLDKPMQLYLFHALSVKKLEDKPYQYSSVQRFFNQCIVKHIPDSIQLSQKQTNLKIHLFTKKVFRHLCNIFPTKTHLFSFPMCFYIRTFSLY